MNSSSFQNCLEAALRYFNYRPRSEAEIRKRLKYRGFDNALVNEVISHLKAQKLIDDDAFAQFWKDNRQFFRPRSQRLIRLELKEKGIASEIIDRVTQDIDDEANAYTVGRKSARLLVTSDYKDFCQRLTSYLRRRGFGYEVINHTIMRLWQELKSL